VSGHFYDYEYRSLKFGRAETARPNFKRENRGAILFMRFVDRIEAIMKNNGQPSPAWLEKTLYIASWVYALGVRLRTTVYDQGIIKSRQLPCVVISIGNVTMGGSGKTPLTIYIAKKLCHLGYRVAVLSRGYGGKAEKSGAIVSDGLQIFVSADVSGDEPYMMARQLTGTPVLVGADRYRSGKIAVRSFKPEVILLDDGFQHRRLARDLDLVLLDASKPGGNGYLFPRGVLREPLQSLRRGHAVILTRTQLDCENSNTCLGSLPDSIPVFKSRHRPNIVKMIPAGNISEVYPASGTLAQDLDVLKGKRVLAFSGIAANEIFFETLRAAGCRLVEAMPYRDHHRYSRADINQIRQNAEKQQASMILTTEKDYYRLPQTTDWGSTLTVVGVEIKFQDELFDEFLDAKVAFHLNQKHNMGIPLNGSG
jgi:tetraacyldisaccharide 4'-kinase